MGIVGSMSDTLSAGRQETSWVWLWAASSSRPFREEKSHYTNIIWMQTCLNIQCFRSVIFSLTDYTHEWSIFWQFKCYLSHRSAFCRCQKEPRFSSEVSPPQLWPVSPGRTPLGSLTESVGVCSPKNQSMTINPRWHPLLANTCSALSLLKHLYIYVICFFICFTKGLRKCFLILQHKK